MLVKICGLTTPEMIVAAGEAGASHIGLVHFEKSVRHVSLSEAATLRQAAPKTVKTVLLLVNADIATTGKAIASVQPDVVQFHGRETPEWAKIVREKTGVEVWKALGVRGQSTLDAARTYAGCVDRILFDAPPPSAQSEVPGGNGVGFDWRLLKDHDHHTPWALAGGLGPNNVADAIRQTGTPMVDASSGLESAPGIKDVDLIRAFCKAAQDA